ncbi:ankyrin [Phanerochaete sordida]|uniref:Ankyrin n=1 Tax=Phanerochaete sordida TaxID=48140 RepID=A0A9P3FVY7_9APHY|nr:ankyrin [Phanerochaete sordida]
MAEKDPTIRLRRAVKENNLFLVKRLAKRTDVRNPDPTHRRYTSLAWAAVLGHEETFEYLLSIGHDDREISRDSENNTILIILADSRPPVSGSASTDHEFYGATLRMARQYYDRYPETLDWANSDGKTAMHLAAMRGNEELVRMLCDFGADLDLADNEGNTPLHYASAWGHVLIVQALIERGCQFNVRNNDGSTPSDYAYSTSIRDVLQDTARSQVENNRRARKAAQAAARGTEWEGHAPPLAAARLSNGSIPRQTNGSIRMRSGSGTSRTTTTSDSGEYDNHSTPARTRYVPPAFSSLSPQRNGTPLPPPLNSPPYPSASSVGSNSILSVPSPTPAQHGNLAPAPGVAPGLSPIANRMRERDMEAMEKYKLRNRSGSAATASTDANDSAVSSGGKSRDDDVASLQSYMTVGSVAPRKLLRPSASAAQLRSSPQPLSSSSASTVSQHPELRSRSGTDPDVLHHHSSSASSITSPLVERTPASPATPTQTSARPPLVKASLSRDSTKDAEYAGPSSEFAKFPPPPAVERSHTPTLLSRRLPFLLSSHKHNEKGAEEKEKDKEKHHHHIFSHKRNSSANSVASRIT